MRLLIVEDDQDGREMLTELFRMHAWDVTPVPSAVAAMVELRAGGFDVILSDENLEGASGSAMLREASKEGLLKHVGALMYTAQAGQLELPPGVKVLQKPMGISLLVDAVTAAASYPPSFGERLKPASASAKSGPVELVLYVTDSPQSRRALRTMQSVLDQVNAQRVKVVIRNIEDDPAACSDESIVVAPVLVKKRPGEQERFVGNLDSAPSLAALLHDLESRGAPPSSANMKAARSEHRHEHAPPSSRAR